MGAANPLRSRGPWPRCRRQPSRPMTITARARTARA